MTHLHLYSNHYLPQALLCYFSAIMSDMRLFYLYLALIKTLSLAVFII